MKTSNTNRASRTSLEFKVLAMLAAMAVLANADALGVGSPDPNISNPIGTGPGAKIMEVKSVIGYFKDDVIGQTAATVSQNLPDGTEVRVRIAKTGNDNVYIREAKPYKDSSAITAGSSPILALTAGSAKKGQRRVVPGSVISFSMDRQKSGRFVVTGNRTDGGADPFLNPPGTALVYREAEDGYYRYWMLSGWIIDIKIVFKHC